MAETSPTRTTPKPLIVVVEDEPELAKLIAEYLERSVLDFPSGVGEDRTRLETNHRVAGLSGISDDEVEQMLLAKLKELK